MKRKREHNPKHGKKRLLLILAAILAIPSLYAQDENIPTVSNEPVTITSKADVLLNQHWAMPTLTNPAATGDIDFIRVRGGARLDYLGSRESPKNYLITGDSPFKLLGKRIGAGVVVNIGSYDLFRNLQINAQGSYKLQLKQNNLSIGLQIGYFHTKFKGSQLRVSDLGGGSTDTGLDDNTPEGDGEQTPNPNPTPDKPADDGNHKYTEDYPTHDVSGGALDLGIGIRFNHPKFYVGISGLHLTNTTIKMSTEGESGNDARYIRSKLPATLYFDTGGNIPIHNTLFTLQPSMILATDFSDFAGMAEMRATYNNRVTFGLNYRYNRAAGVLAGLIMKNFYLGYSWEYDYSSNPRGSTGNHEIVIGYQFKLDMGGKNLFSHRSIRIM